jgi:hypothetical protein
MSSRLCQFELVAWFPVWDGSGWMPRKFWTGGLFTLLLGSCLLFLTGGLLVPSDMTICAITQARLSNLCPIKFLPRAKSSARIHWTGKITNLYFFRNDLKSKSPEVFVCKTQCLLVCASRYAIVCYSVLKHEDVLAPAARSIVKSCVRQSSCKISACTTWHRSIAEK